MDDFFKDEVIYLEPQENINIRTLLNKNIKTPKNLLMYLLKNFKVSANKQDGKFFIGLKKEEFTSSQWVVLKTDTSCEVLFFCNVKINKNVNDIEALNELVVQYLSNPNQIKPILYYMGSINSKKPSFKLLYTFLDNLKLINESIKQNKITFLSNSNLVFLISNRYLYNDSYNLTQQINTYDGHINKNYPSWHPMFISYNNQTFVFSLYDEPLNIEFKNSNNNLTLNDFNLTNNEDVLDNEDKKYLSDTFIELKDFYPIICFYKKFSYGITNKILIWDILANKNILGSVLNSNFLINVRNKFFNEYTKDTKYDLDIRSNFFGDDIVAFEFRLNYNLFQIFNFNNSNFKFYLKDIMHPIVFKEEYQRSYDLLNYLSSLNLLNDEGLQKLSTYFLDFSNRLIEVIKKLKGSCLSKNLAWLTKNNYFIKKIIPKNLKLDEYDMLNKEDILSIDDDLCLNTKIWMRTDDLKIFEIYKKDKEAVMISFKQLLNGDLKEIVDEIENNHDEYIKAKERANSLLEKLNKGSDNLLEVRNNDETNKIRR